MAYDNNITPGRPPLLWSDVNKAFDRINENFTIIGSALARNTPINIAHVELSNPVRIVTVTDHDYVEGQRVTISDTGVSQLDNNTYFVKPVSADEFDLYSNELLTTAVDGAGYDAYGSGGGEAQGLSEFASIDFDNLTNDLSPKDTEVYTLGTATQRWKSLHVGEYVDSVVSRNNGLFVGSAQIKGIQGTVDLPAGSTVNGSLIIDTDKTFFKEVQVDFDQVIVASDFVDSLNLLSGDAIEMSVDSGAESITITNIGVTELATGAGLSVDKNTKDITITNTGVLSFTNSSTLPDDGAGTFLTAGTGIAASSSTGNITLTNTGVIDITPGVGISISRDNTTGVVTVTNGAAAQFGYSQLIVNGTVLNAASTTDTVIINTGYGLTVTAFDDLNPGGDLITLAVDNKIDIIGSVFADDSSIMVNALDQSITAANGFYGNITGNVTGNVNGEVVGDLRGSVFADDSSIMINAIDHSVTASGGFYGNLTGYQTGDMRGSVFADDSSVIVNAIDHSVTASGGFIGDLVGTHTGNVLTNNIDSDDSSQITVVPSTVFNSDVTVENELFVGNSRVIPLNELKSIAAASADFTAFKAAIAAL